MKKKTFVSLLVAATGLLFCSCDDTIEVNRIASLSQAGIYTANYSTKGKTLSLDVVKESSDTNLTLVVNVDEVSDTIRTKSFSKKYSLSKGTHSLSVESGYELENNPYVISINTKTTTTITID